MAVQSIPARLRRAVAVTLRRSHAGRRALSLLLRLLDRWRAARLSRQGAEAKRVWRGQAEARLSSFLSGSERLLFPRAEAPDVTVLIVLYNQAALTLACLESLIRVRGVTVELVVVDNASTDATPAMLARLDGAVVIRNETNEGFLRAVNQGARRARGRFLLLLNNDAVVEPDSLALAVGNFAAAEVGAVGARIVLPDGRLQEAGSIVWRDGSCLGYARGGDPGVGEVMFRRTVDFCSGAFLMVRRELFEMLGGFDERFAPAYYEETDLCLRLWEAGHAVVYDPRVRITHLEFGSAASSGWALAQQRRNQAIFAEKHAAALARRAAPGDVMKGRCWPAPRHPVLIVDDHVPRREIGAGFPRAAALLEAVLRRSDAVTLYTTERGRLDWDMVRRAVPPDVEVIQDQGPGRLEAFLRARAGYYRTVIVSRPHNMAWVAPLKRRHPEWFAGARLIYDAEAIFAEREIRRAEVEGRSLPAGTADRMRRREIDLAAEADLVVAVGPHDAGAFRRAGMADVRILGHALTPRPLGPGPETRQGLLFVGNLDHDDGPNADSLVWFMDRVLPELSRRLGAVPPVTAVGTCRSARVQALAARGLRLAGPVPDLAPFYAGHRAFIAPTRFAAGIPHKVHEAAAAGLPVIATPLLVGQLGWREDRDVLSGPDAAGFAGACARLLTDDALWVRLREAALERVAADCDPAAFARAAEALLDSAPDVPASAASAASSALTVDGAGSIA